MKMKIKQIKYSVAILAEGAALLAFIIGGYAATGYIDILFGGF